MHGSESFLRAQPSASQEFLPVGSLPYSQTPTTCPYPESDQTSPFPHFIA